MCVTGGWVLFSVCCWFFLDLCLASWSLGEAKARVLLCNCGLFQLVIVCDAHIRYSIIVIMSLLVNDRDVVVDEIECSFRSHLVLTLHEQALPIYGINLLALWLASPRLFPLLLRDMVLLPRMAQVTKVVILIAMAFSFL
ncbi:unnamed protein product [Prunus brigantina]